jgi:hypothetical protein
VLPVEKESEAAAGAAAEKKNLKKQKQWTN